MQTSADLSQLLKRLPDVRFTTAATPRLQVIHVDARKRYQRVIGVGGAMTDSSAWLIDDKLSATTRDALMTNLFAAGGIHLNFTLVPMGASDFTRNGRPYTYDDMPSGQSDPNLLHFSVSHDDAYIVPTLKEMLAVNPQTTILAVPWSAPAWMKANHALDNRGHRGTLLSSAYRPLAGYFVKFIQAYARRGIPVAAASPENQPNAAPPYPGMNFPASSEAQWITHYLAPALRAANLHTLVYGSSTAWGNPSYPNALVSGPARSALSGRGTAIRGCRM